MPNFDEATEKVSKNLDHHLKTIMHQVNVKLEILKAFFQKLEILLQMVLF